MVINDKGFVIYHIPKTGGTSVRRAFKESEGNREDLVHDQHEKPAAFRKRLPSMNLLEVLFVRNPWERMESSYRHVKKYHGVVQEHYPQFHHSRS